MGRTARDIMTKDPLTVARDLTVTEAEIGRAHV